MFQSFKVHGNKSKLQRRLKKKVLGQQSSQVTPSVGQSNNYSRKKNEPKNVSERRDRVASQEGPKRHKKHKRCTCLHFGSITGSNLRVGWRRRRKWLLQFQKIVWKETDDDEAKRGEVKMGLSIKEGEKMHTERGVTLFWREKSGFLCK